MHDLNWAVDSGKRIIKLEPPFYVRQPSEESPQSPALAYVNGGGNPDFFKLSNGDIGYACVEKNRDYGKWVTI